MARHFTITHQQAFGHHHDHSLGHALSGVRVQLLAWREMHLQEDKAPGAAPDRAVLLSLGVGLLLVAGLFSLVPLHTLGI
jgi:hypothetical protein